MTPFSTAMQHRAHLLGPLKEAALFRSLPVHRQGARDGALVGIGNEAVDAMPEGALARPGGPHDQDLFPGVDVQIHIQQRGLLLAEVLEAEIMKGNDGLAGRHIFSRSIFMRVSQMATDRIVPFWQASAWFLAYHGRMGLSTEGTRRPRSCF